MPPKRPLPDDPNAPRQPQRPPPPLNFSKARACKLRCERKFSDRGLIETLQVRHVEDIRSSVNGCRGKRTA